MKTFLFLLLGLLNLIAEDIDKNKVDELFSKGEYENVIELLDGKISSSQENYHLWFTLGKAYQGLLNYNKSNDALYEAYKYNKFDLPLLMAIGRNYVQMGASEYSLLFYEQAYDLQPDNFIVMIELAKSYYDVRKFDKAKSIYQKLTDKDSSNAYYSKQLGMCCYKMNDAQTAIEWLYKSHMHNERDGSVAFILAGLLVNKNEYREALKTLHESQEHNPSNLQTNKLIAETLFKMKRYGDAANGYKLIIDDGDSTAMNFQKLGFCFYFLESADNYEYNVADSLKYNSALYAFGKAIEKDTTDALSYIYSGICYKERREYKKSVELISKGIQKTVPSYLSDAYAQLGSSYDLSENFSSAIKCYQKALKLDSEKENILFHLAAVYDRYYKDKKVAMIYYTKFLNTNDSQDEIMKNYALERIEKLKEVVHFQNGRAEVQRYFLHRTPNIK